LNSTSPQATVAALNALEAPVIWIAGGDDKGLAFDELALAASERVRRVMLLPGPGSARIADALERRGSAAPEVSRHDALADAVDEAAAVARPGEAVLLSPACPGFWGHYVNGAAGAGGEELGFRALVRRLGPGSQEASKTDEGGDS
jgi:UDP-N-acetylmuramoylalanine--D-glutamate ligase